LRLRRAVLFVVRNGLLPVAEGSTVTARELVIAAINHRETTPVPWCIDFTTELEEKLLEQFSPEWFDAIGNCITTVQHPAWHFKDVPDSFRTEDLPAALPPARGTGRGYDDFHDELNQTAAGDRFTLVRMYASMFEKAWMTRGMERLMEDLVLRPAFAEKFFDKVVHMDLACMDLMLENPRLDGFLLGSDWGGQDKLLMGPRIWRNILKPRYKRLFQRVRDAGKYLFLHSCGCIEAIIPDLIDMGLQVLNPVQPECMDIRKLKREYGKHLCFWGGISTQKTLPYGTPDELREELREVLAFMRKGGGYILAPAQHLQLDVPLENIQAFIEFARAQS